MLRKIVHTFGTRVLAAAVNLAVAVVLSQFLGPAGKGSQSIIITTISIILIFSNLVGGATLVYLAPRFSAFLLLIPSYAWAVLMGLLSWLILALTGLVEQGYLIHICVLSVISALVSIHSNILIGQQRIRESNLLALLQSVILVAGLLVGFLLIGEGSIYTYLYSLYLSFLSCALISFILIRSSFKGARLLPLTQYRPVTIQLFRYGFHNQVAHITQMLSFRLSYYVLEEYKGMAAVGIFGNGISIAESIWLVAKSMSLVQYSWISNSSDREASARLTLRLVKASIILSLLILLPIMLLPPLFYTFVFGPGFAEVRTVIWALSPGVLIYNVSILLGHYYSGTGRYYMNSRISGAGFLVSLLLYFTMIPALGINGAGLATSVSYFFTSLLFIWFFARECPYWYTELIPRKDDFRKVVSLIREAGK